MKQFTRIVTDDTMMELVQHGNNAFPFQYYYEDIEKFENRRIDWHWHHELEFVTVTSGTVFCAIGSKTLKLCEGDGIFVNSGVIHHYTCAEKGVIANILFSPYFIAPADTHIFQAYIEPITATACSHIVFHAQVPWQQSILSALDTIYALCHRQPPAWELDTQALLSKIWTELYKHREALHTIESAGITQLTQARLHHMTAFMSQSYSCKLTLQQIAQAAGISESEALRCFKQGMQTTPIHYLCQLRLRHARSLLLTTSHTITEIAARVGFESVGYFDRCYRRAYGITPTQQRKQALNFTASAPIDNINEHEGEL